MRTYRYHVEWRGPGEEGWTALVPTHRAWQGATIHAREHVAVYGGTCRTWDSRSRIFGGEIGPDLVWHSVDNMARHLADLHL